MIAADFRRLRRGTLDLTQGELAALLNRTTRMVSAYENGEAPIPAEIALAIECLVIRHKRAVAASASPSPASVPQPPVTVPPKF